MGDNKSGKWGEIIRGINGPLFPRGQIKLTLTFEVEMKTTHTITTPAITSYVYNTRRIATATTNNAFNTRDNDNGDHALNTLYTGP